MPCSDVVLLALDLAEGGELFDFMMYTGAFSEQVGSTAHNSAQHTMDGWMDGWIGAGD